MESFFFERGTHEIYGGELGVIFDASLFVVEVDDHDLLPRAQRHRSLVERNRQRRLEQSRPHVRETVAVTPTFMGSDPAEVLEGAYAGWMIQQAEDEKGLLLFQSLDSGQRKMAVIASTAPADVITGPTRGDQLKQPSGLPISALNDSQRELFKQLLLEYVHNYKNPIAHQQLQRIRRTGIDKIYFAWAGTGLNEPYYYRIHGPTILIEFNNNYAPGSEAGPINHIHTVFREPGNDYGEDLLRQHMEKSPHHQPAN